MLVHRLPWAVAVGLAAGLVCGNVQATGPEADAINVPTSSQVTAVVSQADYYLQAVPGTDQMRKVYIFSRLDRNHNGQLERSELPQDMHTLRSRFVQADWNHNGLLSPDEYLMWSHHQVPHYTPIYHGFVYVYAQPGADRR